MSLFALRGELTRRQGLILGISGLGIFLLAWWALAELMSVQRPVIEDFETHLPSTVVPDTLGGRIINLDSLARADSLRFANATEFVKVYPLLPPPGRVLQAFVPLIKEEGLFPNAIRSIWLNLQGYFWAVLIAVPIGFIIGLFPLFRGLFSQQVDVLRYLPLTALTGLFIIWFGIEDQMKIAFLAFGILVYLLPVVVQRIREVDDVYLQTVFTLGADAWQTIRTVYFPAVFSKLMEDVRVLTAISWTYIIIAELLNRQGGIGALIYVKARQGQIDKVFAILILIVLIGFLQDRLFGYIDRRLFPHKYYQVTREGEKEAEYGILTILGVMAAVIFAGIFWPAGGALVGQLALLMVVASVLIVLYGEFKVLRAQTNRK
jgi:NitT/TauT family transport system permease protein